MHRPLVYVTVITIALLALGAPFLHISWGGTDARTLPAASTIRQVSEALDSEFPLNSTAPIEALITGASALAGGRAALDPYPPTCTGSTRSPGSPALGSPGRAGTSSGSTSATPRPPSHRPPGTS
jgi:trehalose monomycolate/heme transporter